MNKWGAQFAVATLIAAGIAQARDLGADEALKLRDAGTIQSLEKLNAAAIAKHPGATVVEQAHGRYIYQVELRDAQGVQWGLDLDASTGEVLQDQRDG